MLAMVLLLVLAAAGVLGAAVGMAAPQLGWLSLALTALAGAMLFVDARRRRTRSTEASSPSKRDSSSGNSNGNSSSGDGNGEDGGSEVTRSGENGRTTGKHRLSRGEQPARTTVHDSDSSAGQQGSRRSTDVFAAQQRPAMSGQSTEVSPDAGGASESPTLVGAGAHEQTVSEGVGAAAAVSAAAARGSSATGAARGFVEPEPAVEQSDVGTSTKAELNTEIRVIDERPRYHLSDCTWLARQSSVTSLPLLLRQAQVLGFTPCADCGPDLALARRFRGDKF